MLTHSVRGRAVLTVEGLQDDSGALHPVQQAFVDELAPQCGYCTPGQIMSAVALLRENPNPTRDDARHALSGNLCRCGAYDHYLNAVLTAAKRMRTSGQIA
jgi:aerobic-type carbon monoxide dehydrogenase small subunit (CoxS/CutS family)